MILGLDIGASNIKASLIENVSGEITNIQIPTFTSGDAYSALVAVRKGLGLTAKDRLEAIAVTCSPFLQAPTYERGLIETDKSVRRTFKKLLASRARVVYLGRDGRFRSFGQITRDFRNRYLNIVKYVDANWFPLVYLVRETQHVSDFVCASFGTSSTSLVPVINGKPQVGLTENRLSSRKLVLMGKLYTPVVSFMDELEFRGAKIPWNPYENQLTIGEVAFSSGFRGARPWTVPERDIRFEVAKKMSWSVGGDMKLVTRAEVKNLRVQIMKKFRTRLVERVKNVIETVPPKARVVYVCGFDNRFFVDLISSEFTCVDTRLDNTATAYGTAMLYCRTEKRDGYDCPPRVSRNRSEKATSGPVPGVG